MQKDFKLMISQHVTIKPKQEIRNGKTIIDVNKRNDKYNFNQRRLDAAIKILDIIQKSLDKK